MMRDSRTALLLLLPLLLLGAGFLPASALADSRPAPLKIDSGFGSGSFGTWKTDSWGLPSYRYEIDEEKNPIARQDVLDGSTDAWHQLGNDRFVATAYNHGYVKLWTQDRRYQWLNRYDPDHGHYSGGFGYLNLGGEVISTLYDDRPDAAGVKRQFGVGYSRSSMRSRGISIDQRVYAPFGDESLLIHDVTLRNTSRQTRNASWFEYWDVNPFDQGEKRPVGLGRPRTSDGRRTLVVDQVPDVNGNSQSIFAASLKGPVDGFETTTAGFFGSGDRAVPDAVAADRLGESIAAQVPDGQVGSTMFAFRSPVRLRPGGRVTLRYAYGYGGQVQINRMLRRYRKTPSPLARSQRAWKRWLPRIRFGQGRAWLSRELMWNAYTLRSASVYEQCAGSHLIPQGGYYTYDWGEVAAYRDPLQHMLPLIYADPSLARDVLIYSARQQPRSGIIPYSMGAHCRPANLEAESNDPDLWLLLAAAEYGLASRDRSLFARQVSFRGGGRGTLLEHLKVAFRRQESLRTERGTYLSLQNGDWSDLSTIMLGMSESALVTTQVAFIYPRLAELAEMLGDSEFAGKLRRAGKANLEITRSLWTGGGWYARGYSGDNLIGQGVIYGEPQPWAILAGAPSAARARKLVANIRRLLTGVGAPGGPSPIGSSMSPARDDPLVTETSSLLFPDFNSAVFPGQTWFAVNGWLVWALARLEGTVPRATRFAFDEFLRNTLAYHADAYPDQWDGIISVDDMCRSWYSNDKPGYCGIFEPMGYQGQIMHQPAWSLFDAIKLAGIEPTRRGYRITPHLPVRHFSVELPRVGVAYGARRARGYVRPSQGGRLKMLVALPREGKNCRPFSGGSSMRFTRASGLIRFTLFTRQGKPARWTIRCRA